MSRTPVPGWARLLDEAAESWFDEAPWWEGVFVDRWLAFRGRETREAARLRRDRELRAAALAGYVEHAFEDWFARHPEAPDWMLPAADELASPRELGGGPRRWRVDGVTTRSLLDELRERAQPDLTVGGVRFPGAHYVRAALGPERERLTLDEEQQAAHEAWASRYLSWHDGWVDPERQVLDAMARRPLDPPGFVWRQHRLVPEVDGLDLATAAPGATFTLPHPVACRDVPETMGSIARFLPRRDRQREGHGESVVYLEIWAVFGGVLPRRGLRDEREVLLPANSAFQVVRHLDLPRASGSGHRADHAHGIQLLQLS